MKKYTQMCNDFCDAWDILLDFPLPLAHEKGRDTGIAAAIPFIGFLLGIAAACAGSLIGGLCGPWAGTLLFTAAGLALLNGKDSGRGTTALVSAWLRRSRSRYAAAEYLWDYPVPVALLGGLLLAEAAILAGLSCTGHMSFLAVVLTGGAAVQGMLALEGENPLLGGGEEARKPLLWSTLLCAAVLFLIHPAAVLASAAAVWFGLREFRRMFDVFTPEVITFCGALTELFLLLVGVFFAL